MSEIKYQITKDYKGEYTFNYMKEGDVIWRYLTSSASLDVLKNRAIRHLTPKPEPVIVEAGNFYELKKPSTWAVFWGNFYKIIVA